MYFYVLKPSLYNRDSLFCATYSPREGRLEHLAIIMRFQVKCLQKLNDVWNIPKKRGESTKDTWYGIRRLWTHWLVWWKAAYHNKYMQDISGNGVTFNWIEILGVALKNQNRWCLKVFSNWSMWLKSQLQIWKMPMWKLDLSFKTIHSILRLLTSFLSDFW